MKIEMGKEYAYRENPTVPVRVLCVDRPDVFNVVVMSQIGHISTHYGDGRYTLSRHTTGHDLVPLQKPVEWWGVTTANGGFGNAYQDEETAKHWAHHFNGRYFKLVEVLE